MEERKRWEVGIKGIHEGRIEKKRRNGQSTINVRTLVARGTYIHTYVAKGGKEERRKSK